MRKTAVLLIFAVLLFQGCARGLPPGDMARLKGRKVIAVTYAPPGFAVARGGYIDAFYGMIGFESWTEAVREGKRWVEEYALIDPSIKAGRVFLTGLKRLNMDTLSFQEMADDSPGAFRKAFGEKGFVFDIRTTRWMLTYFPADATRHRLTYEARARLISLEGPEIIWKARCRYTEGDIRKSATLSEFEANHAALLRDRLSEAADSCAKELSGEFFGKED